MFEVRQTLVFRDWLAALKDHRAVSKIGARIDRLAVGNFGDVKPVGEGVSELRVNYGPGYRMYIAQRGPVLVVVLCGGDKSTQRRDIVRAKALARDLEV